MSADQKQWASTVREKAERLFPGNGVLQSRWMTCVAADHFNMREGKQPCLLMHGAPAKWGTKQCHKGAK